MAMKIISFPRRKIKPFIPLKWERCNVPFFTRIFRPFTNFGQTLRARKPNGRWVYMREGDREPMAQ